MHSFQTMGIQLHLIQVSADSNRTKRYKFKLVLQDLIR